MGASAPPGQVVAAGAFQVDSELCRVTSNDLLADLAGRALLAAPILVHNDLLGYVVGYAAQDAESVTRYAGNLQLVADFISDKAYTEYELRNLTEELLEKYSEITLVYDISEALSAVLDQQAVCVFIIQKIVGVVGVDRASIMLYDEDSDRLHIVASHGLDLSDEEIRNIRVAPNEQVSGSVFSTGRHALIENVQDVPALDLPAKLAPYKKKSFLCIPIVLNSMNMQPKVLGVINLTDKISNDIFTTNDLRLLTAIASQAAMALYNIQLVEEVRKAERFQQEMEIAQGIQRGLLPNDFPGIPGLDLAGRCLPATQVGGDYYDFFQHSASELGVVIADVSGHDVGSAFIMATARSSLRSEVLARKSPAHILKDTNFVLHKDLSQAEKFITMFYAEYDSRTQFLRYANAAQNPPLLLRGGACQMLDTDGIFIGMWENVDFEEKTIHLQRNDFVMFYTDGVVEAKNDAHEMFGTDRLIAVLEATPAHVTAQSLLKTVYDTVARFAGNAERSDDITVVVLKVLNPV